MGGQGDCDMEDTTILAQLVEREPTGGEVGRNSKRIITPLSGKRWSCQMCAIRWR